MEEVYYYCIFPVMLVNEYNKDITSEGLVYIQHEGVWGTICSQRFDDHDARVICRELGFNHGRAVPEASIVSTGF